jgi:hypothetical protein
MNTVVKPHVAVAHSQYEAMSSESLLGLQVGEWCVPGDIDVGGHQRIDESGIT